MKTIKEIKELCEAIINECDKCPAKNFEVTNFFCQYCDNKDKYKLAKEITCENGTK